MKKVAIHILFYSYLLSQDSTPLEIQSLSFNPLTINTSESAATSIATIRVTDDLSGIYSLNLEFKSTNGTDKQFYWSAGTQTGITDTTLQIEMTWPQYSEEGDWNLYRIGTDDVTKNSLRVYQSDLDAKGFDTKIVNDYNSPILRKVPSAYSTIQAGLNAASAGDTVLVAAGTYAENIIWPNVNGIKLISAGDSSNTIIDGGGTSTVIYMNPSSATIDTTTLIQGFKITNGGGVSDGGGILISNSGLTILDSRIESNSATSHGGGIYGYSSNVQLRNCDINSNEVSGTNPGGGGGGIYQWKGNLYLEDCSIENNVGYYGGGIALFEVDLDFVDLLVSKNQGVFGGGMHVDGQTSINARGNNIISFNTGTRGGGVYLQCSLKNVIIINNQASTSGGGIYLHAENITIDSSVIARNYAVKGGGIYLTRVATIKNATIQDNTGAEQINSELGIKIKNSNISMNENLNNITGVYYFNGIESTSISNCNFITYGTAIHNTISSVIVDADSNYWRHSSGPYHPSQNPTGQGDSVNAFVNVTPWLTAPNTDAPPIPAQNLKLDSQTVTSATFSWDASNIGDLSGYKIYYDTDSSGYPYANSVDLGNVVTKSLTGLTTGTKYYIAVTTYDTDGNESWYSKEVSVTMNNTPVIAAVSDVTMNEDESSTITLTATDVENDAITYSAVSDTNAVTVSVSSATLTLTPNANWHGVANIKAYASDGYSKDSTSFVLTVTSVSDMAAVDDVTIDEDKSAEVTLTSTFTGTTTFTAVSDTNAVTTSVSSSTLTLTPTANWHGVAKIKAYASDGTSKDSTSFTLTVTSVNDLPTAFDWVGSALDTINITQSNLADTYTLQWDASTDVDGDSITYLLYAGTGASPKEEVYDTTSTSPAIIFGRILLLIPYQELLQKTFEQIPMLSRATVKFSVSATDGIDTVKVSGDDRVVFVNRYEYLSTEGEGVPVEFALHENYPNPFNPTTTLRFDLPEVSNLTLTIYNMLGQKVKTFNYQNTSAGYHSVKWNATNDYGDPVGAGVYLYQLQTKDFVKTRKMVLLK